MSLSRKARRGIELFNRLKFGTSRNRYVVPRLTKEERELRAAKRLQRMTKAAA